MSPPVGWTGVVTLEFDTALDADRMARTLAPEAAREVPRAHARLTRPRPESVVLEVSAPETGAFRAALNTYLGWIHLVLTTVEVARER